MARCGSEAWVWGLRSACGLEGQADRVWMQGLGFFVGLEGCAGLAWPGAGQVVGPDQGEGLLGQVVWVEI